MCILLCYTYATCPHVAKSGIYTCYAAKTSGRGFDEKCATFKITSQKLRWKKEAKRCASCLEVFGEEAPVRRKRVGKLRKEGKEDQEKREGEGVGADGDGDGVDQVKEVVKGEDVGTGEKAVKGKKVGGEELKHENQD